MINKLSNKVIYNAKTLTYQKPLFQMSKSEKYVYAFAKIGERDPVLNGYYAVEVYYDAPTDSWKVVEGGLEWNYSETNNAGYYPLVPLDSTTTYMPETIVLAAQEPNNKRFWHPVAGGTGSGGVSSIIAKTTGKIGDLYTIDLYGNGKFEVGTGTATLEVLQCHIQTDLPAGTWLVVFPKDLTVLSGTI